MDHPALRVLGALLAATVVRAVAVALASVGVLLLPGSGAFALLALTDVAGALVGAGLVVWAAIAADRPGRLPIAAWIVLALAFLAARGLQIGLPVLITPMLYSSLPTDQIMQWTTVRSLAHAVSFGVDSVGLLIAFGLLLSRSRSAPPP